MLGMIVTGQTELFHYLGQTQRRPEVEHENDKSLRDFLRVPHRNVIV